MLDVDQLVLCEHDREPDDCPICRGDEVERSIFDAFAWAEAYVSTSQEAEELPDELAGVPLN